MPQKRSAPPLVQSGHCPSIKPHVQPQQEVSTSQLAGVFRAGLRLLSRPPLSMGERIVELVKGDKSSVKRG